MANKRIRDIGLITIAIYVDDHKDLVEMCKKNQTFPDKFHEIIQEIKNKIKTKKQR